MVMTREHPQAGTRTQAQQRYGEERYGEEVPLYAGTRIGPLHVDAAIDGYYLSGDIR